MFPFVSVPFPLFENQKMSSGKNKKGKKQRTSQGRLSRHSGQGDHTMWPVPRLWLCKWFLRLPRSDSEAHVDTRPSRVLFASGARGELYVCVDRFSLATEGGWCWEWTG